MSGPFKMNPGRGPMQKTGRGIPMTFQSPVAQSSIERAQKAAREKQNAKFSSELNEVRSNDQEGGFMNTLSNIGTGLKHGWNSVGYDSQGSGKKGDFLYEPGGNKDLGKSISNAVSTAYDYARGVIPNATTETNRPKPKRKAQKTYLD